MVDSTRRRLTPALLGLGGAAIATGAARADVAGLGTAPLGVPGGATPLDTNGNVPAANLGNAPFTVASIAALRALPFAVILAGAACSLAGYYASGDRGGGTFVWAASSTLADDGGTVIKPTANAGSGRWLRALTGPLTTKHMGAAADGVTNDTAVITAAMAASVRLGVQLTVSVGTHMADGLSLPSGCMLTAEVRGLSIIQRLPSAVAVSLLSAVSLHSFYIENIVWDGNKANQSVGANTVILNGCYDYRVEGCSFINAKAVSGGYGTGLMLYNSADDANGTASIALNNKATVNDFDGLHVHGTAANLTISTNRSWSNGGTGIVIENTQYPPVADTTHRIIVIANHCFGNKNGIAAGGYISGGTAAAPVYGPGFEPDRMLIISDNHCYANTGYGIVAQARDSLITSNTCCSNGGTGNIFAGIVCNSEDCTISNNICNDNEWYGIDAGGITRGIISGNQCKRNGKQSTTATGGTGIDIGAAVSTECFSNHVEDHNGVGIDCPRIDGPGNGIAFAQEAQQVRIRQNTIVCTSASQGAIWVRNDVLQVEVIDNKVYGLAYNSLEQFIVESTDCLIRSNKGSDTSYNSNGYASGTSVYFNFPDWLEDSVINVSGTTTLTGIATRTVTKFTGAVYKIVVVGATGFTSVPTVTISGGGGSGATATAWITDSGSLYIVTNNPGSGYTSAPTVTITGGGGTMTSATAVLGAFNQINGKEMRFLFTGPLTLNTNSALHLAGGTSRTTTGKSSLWLKGYASSLYEIGSTQGMA